MPYFIIDVADHNNKYTFSTLAAAEDFVKEHKLILYQIWKGSIKLVDKKDINS